MGSNHVEVEQWLNPETVERAHGRAILAQEYRHQKFANCGMRAARARDPKLLKALEKGAEIIGKIAENQQGRTRRSVSSRGGETVEATEAQLWREAYRMCDEGTPLENFEWIYGAAAYLAGFQD